MKPPICAGMSTSLSSSEECVSNQPGIWLKKLNYGDDLKVLRRNIADESIDLVYLDPHSSSNRSYNVLFRENRVEVRLEVLIPNVGNPTINCRHPCKVRWPPESASGSFVVASEQNKFA
jgi:hypothetical protein